MLTDEVNTSYSILARKRVSIQDRSKRVDSSIFHLGEEEGVAGDGFPGGGTGAALGEGGEPGLVALAAAHLKEGTYHGTDHIP